jgi:hypothetical protein
MGDAHPELGLSSHALVLDPALIEWRHEPVNSDAG